MENIEPSANDVPSSPRSLKPQSVDDRVEDEMLLSSPQFRPSHLLPDDPTATNLTTDVKKAMQRKSFGRRVSFAATAHVRLYDKAGNDSEKEQEPSDDDFKPMKKRGSPMPPHGSPKTKLSESFMMDESDSSLPSTPSLRGRSMPAPTSLLVPRAESPPSMASFDVDLKDAHSSSFTSYVSGGEEEDNTTMEIHGLSQKLDEDMEFTGCVGGILAKTEAANRRMSTADMDFTVCVGGIIKQLPGTLTINSDLSPASSVDTMELTECVGKIIARQQGQTSLQSSVSLLDLENDEAMMDMEMTMPVQHTIHAERSPFLVDSPRTSFVPGKMTFIGDIDAPDALQQLIESPGRAQSDQQLFQTFINTEQFEEEEEEEQMDQSDMVESHSFVQSALQSRENSLESLLVQTPSASAVEVASLVDFLNETGIRFLENISSLTRRETTGRPRDSDIVLPSKQAFIATALLPQADFYEAAADDLVPRIMTTKDELAQQEAQFNVQPPLAFLQHQRGSPAERQQVLAKLKTLKGVARLLSKHHWHQWRLDRQAHLNSILETNLDTLKTVYPVLQQANLDLDCLLADHLEPVYKQLHAELSALEHLRAFPDEIEQARQLEVTVAEQAQQMASMDAELAELERQEAALHSAIQTAADQKASLASRIEASRQALATTPKITEMLLGELRSLLALRKAATGWEFGQIKPDAITIRFLVGGPVTVRFAIDQERAVTAVQVDCSTARLPILVRAACMFEGLVGKPLATAIHSALLRLDCLVLTHRQLASVNLHCTHEITDHADPSFIPLKLSFFSYEARSKFDILLSIHSPASTTGPLMRPAAFVHHYGPIDEEAVMKDYVGLACSNTAVLERVPVACKNLVTAMQALLEEHAVDGRPSDAFSLCLHSGQH